MKKRQKFVIAIIALIITLCGFGYSWLKKSTYQPTTKAQGIALTDGRVENNVTVFQAKHSKNLEVIFYPGALVEPNSYSIWARQLANEGYTVKIAHFPLNLAILRPNVANRFVAKNEPFVIGGHSLGGAMAARYVHNNYRQRNIKGIFFLGAYADKKGKLDKLNLPALSIVASRDGVLNWQKYQQNKKYLPRKTTFKTIRGGNHGGFGSYGFQKGDKSAHITNSQQQALIAEDISNWLEKIAK